MSFKYLKKPGIEPSWGKQIPIPFWKQQLLVTKKKFF